MSIESILQKLQDDLATIDMYHGESSRIGFLVKKLQNIKLKMYQETHHPLPHIHIDYGKNIHTASYSIKDCKRIKGNLHKKYDRTVMQWIEKNSNNLLSLWAETQAGKEIKELIAIIDGD